MSNNSNYKTFWRILSSRKVEFVSPASIHMIFKRFGSQSFEIEGNLISCLKKSSLQHHNFRENSIVFIWFIWRHYKKLIRWLSKISDISAEKFLINFTFSHDPFYKDWSLDSRSSLKIESFDMSYFFIA